MDTMETNSIEDKKTTESVYQLLDTSDPLNYNTLRNLFLEQKSAGGLNIYNNEYNEVLRFIMSEVNRFNQNLRKKYYFSEIKTSALLDLEDPLVQYYCSKFPEKQYQVSSETDKELKKVYSLKPACCANAFALWSKNRKVYNHIYHEVSDCYRIENTGSLRSLSRGCYFTMPDYHMVVENKYENIKEIFLDLRQELAQFYQKLLKKSCKDLFYETYRLYKEDFRNLIAPSLYENAIVIEDLTAEKDEDAPYFDIKQEFTLKNKKDKDLQCGTIQVDLKNPKAFNLDNCAVIHFSMGSLQRILDLLICQDKIPKLGLKVKFLNPTYQEEFLNHWSDKYGLLIDNKNKVLSESLALKSLKEQIFYSDYLLIGPKEIENNSYTLIDRITKEQFTFNKKDLLEHLEKKNYVQHNQIIFQKNFLNS